MKIIFPILLASALAIPAFAQDAKTNAAPEQTSNSVSLAVVTLPASAGMVSAPLFLTNGSISQPEQTELAGGGKAVYEFIITNPGNYLITAQVNAAGEDANSFFVNVDAAPEDPLMIWDIEVTSEFEEHTVSWRGNRTDSTDEFAPKKFNLSAGAHKLNLVGREPAQLKSISIRQAN